VLSSFAFQVNLRRYTKADQGLGNTTGFYSDSDGSDSDSSDSDKGGKKDNKKGGKAGTSGKGGKGGKDPKVGRCRSTLSNPR